MKGLDLRKFKKMASDGRSTTLKSPEGHKIIIAHHALSPAMKKQLEGISKKYADGGDVPDDGGDIKDTDSAIKSVNDAQPAPAAPAATPVVINVGNAEQKQAAPAPQSAPPPASVPAPAPEPALAAPGDFPAAAPPQSGLAQTPNRAPAQVAPPPTMAPAPQQPAELLPSPPSPEKAQEAVFQKSYNDYKVAHAQEFAQEDAAFAQDLNSGHIKPETVHSLFAKKDTLGKIGTIFGLMFGGMASGVNGGPNQYLEMMKNEIKNDLDAQVNSKGNAQNFIKLNQQQQMQNAQIEQMKKTGTLTEAQIKALSAETGLKSYTLAQLQANRAAFHNQAKMVAKMPEGLQKEQAKQALAMMGTAVTNENANISDMAASKMALMSQLGGAGNGTALRMMGMDKMAADVEEKTIPGFEGRAQIPVPQDTRKELAAQKQYDQKAKEYIEFAKKHSNNWANMNLMERQKIANQGASMAANLQSLYRNKIKGGVYKKGEQEFIEQIIPDQPAKWSASLNAIPKVEQTIRDNRNDLKNTAETVGLKYNSPQESGGAPHDGAIQKSKSGKDIVFKDGKWHYK